MKRHWLSLVVVAALLLALVPAASAQDKEPVTIRFWHHWGGNREPLMQEQIAAFQEAYPWITVEMTLQPWDNRLQTILTSVAAGDPPDVTMLGRQDIPGFVVQDALLPLDDWMERDGITPDMFYAAEFQGAQYNGQTYLLPLPTGGALNILWYNKAMFRDAGLDPEDPPDTWEELNAAAEKLTIVQDGFLERAAIRVTVTGGEEPAFMVWLLTNGGTWISEDLKTIEFNSPQGLETLQWMVDFTNTYNAGFEEQEAFYAQTGEWENGPFYNDYEAMQINGSWEYFKIIEYAPDMELGVAPIPYGPSGGPENRGSAYGGWGYVIPKNAPHPEEAWLLVKWLTTEMEGKGGCWFLQQQKRPSPLIACNEDPASGEGNPLFPDILNIMAQDTWVPIAPPQPQIQQVITQMTQEAMYGTKTVEEALAWGAEECQKLLDEFWAQYGG